MAKFPLTIAITPGAEDGVGPELLLAAIRQELFSDIGFFWCGDDTSLQLAAKRVELPLSITKSGLATIGNIQLDYYPHDIPGSMLERQVRFLEISTALAQKRMIDAIVTGPINKAALAYLDQGVYTGQTEYFYKLADKKKPFMAFLGGPFMLSLVTTHLPLSSVKSAINQALLEEHLESVAFHCGRILRKKPSEVNIYVLGLNPHAGEDGLLGHEEKDLIIPAITSVTKRGLCVEGPWPADGFFAYFHALARIPDVVVAMYHDQGLIPYKLLTQGASVNVTLGLSLPRTSPAHGTAALLVGSKKACGKSTIAAIKTAIDLARLPSV